MEILEVPIPSLGKGQILVRNHYSVISPGTEGKTVTDARKGYIAKAKSRQKEFNQVIELIKTQGIKETYNLVMNKLEAPASLGYSCAGEVIAVGEEVTGFSIGDFVACGGKDACHADVVAVGANLCVKTPKSVSLKHAAFSTIASIALQGIRQSELTLGSNCVVIGLGLIGQITVQLLRSAGIKSIGIDVNDRQVEAARICGTHLSLNRNKEGLEKIILNESNGVGCDAVIITAGSSSLDPVELAGILCRRKGKVVIVGAVPTGFSRENYYKKELELRMSSSYGPGRYDINYEEKGIDYPIAYVRWTENRNMQTFIDLLGESRLYMEHIISHVFSLENAPEAYNMILEKSEYYSGILIEYDTQAKLNSTINLKKLEFTDSRANVSFIGAGSFAQNILLPRLRGLCSFSGVVTAHGNTSRYVAEKYKFSYCTDDVQKILEDNNTDTVFIATRHDLHAKYVLEAIKAGKNIFVEKPLAITEKEAKDVKQAYESIINEKPIRLMVGFNRRFSPFIQRINSILERNQKKTILIRVNAGFVPANHWVNDSQIGGGRIIGEACHFIDLAMYLAGSPIASVYASGFSESSGLLDTVTINLTFENESSASINYLANGNKSISKEYIEIYCNGTVAIIDDFKRLTITGKKTSKYKGNQDKGHNEELVQFINAIKKGNEAPIPIEEIWLSTFATFKVIESVQQKRVILI